MADETKPAFEWRVRVNPPVAGFQTVVFESRAAGMAPRDPAGYWKTNGAVRAYPIETAELLRLLGITADTSENAAVHPIGAAS